MERQRLDAEQQRRRLRLLAGRAKAKAVRLRRQWGAGRSQPVREFVVRPRPAS